MIDVERFMFECVTTYCTNAI